MKILTGQQKASKGRAYLAGFDVETEIRRGRQNLGYCPQVMKGSAMFGSPFPKNVLLRVSVCMQLICRKYML